MASSATKISATSTGVGSVGPVGSELTSLGLYLLSIKSGTGEPLAIVSQGTILKF